MTTFLRDSTVGDRQFPLEMEAEKGIDFLKVPERLEVHIVPGNVSAWNHC